MSDKPHADGDAYCARPGCNTKLTAAQRYRRQRYCSRGCAALDPAYREAQRQATAQANKERWEEWKTEGHDPTHGGQAAEKRGKAIAESNRRRAKRAEPEES